MPSSDSLVTETVPILPIKHQHTISDESSPSPTILADDKDPLTSIIDNNWRYWRNLKRPYPIDDTKPNDSAELSIEIPTDRPESKKKLSSEEIVKKPVILLPTTADITENSSEKSFSSFDEDHDTKPFILNGKIIPDAFRLNIQDETTTKFPFSDSIKKKPLGLFGDTTPVASGKRNSGKPYYYFSENTNFFL